MVRYREGDARNREDSTAIEYMAAHLAGDLVIVPAEQS